jgi:tellurite resistance protein TehA-like permease
MCMLPFEAIRRRIVRHPALSMFLGAIPRGTILWEYVLGGFCAILKTGRHLRDGMPFNLGCWGFTFPLGVYSLATLALACATRLAFFSVVGSVLIMLLAALG